MCYECSIYALCLWGCYFSEKASRNCGITVVADLSQHLPFFSFLCGGYELVLTLGR